jgi:hypothetical protein
MPKQIAGQYHLLRSQGCDNRHVGGLVTQNVALTLIDVTAREVNDGANDTSVDNASAGPLTVPSLP